MVEQSDGARQLSRFLRTRNRAVDGLDEREWRGPFDFVVMADTQFGMMNCSTDNEDDWAIEIEMADLAVRGINAMAPAPRFVVVCGDLVHAMPSGPYAPADPPVPPQAFPRSTFRAALYIAS